MIAIRSVQEVTSGAVTIYLPRHFAAKRVEVIVLPLDDDETEPASLQRLLLAAPTLSESELEGFVQVREWMSQWAVKEF